MYKLVKKSVFCLVSIAFLSSVASASSLDRLSDMHNEISDIFTHSAGAANLAAVNPAFSPISYSPTAVMAPNAMRTSASNRLLGTISISTFLDKHHKIMKLNLGGKDYWVTIAMTPGSKDQYAIIKDPNSANYVMARLTRNAMLGSGVNLRINQSTTYNVKLKPNLWNPDRKSTFIIAPAGRTRGKTYKLNSGKVLDMGKKSSLTLQTKRGNVYMFYGKDIDTGKNKFKNTKSFGITTKWTLEPKAWFASDTKLVEGKAVPVSFGNIRLYMKKSGDTLQIFE
ncbi:hypothetical protein ACFL6Y_10280 [Elusimicrobiota bacterium]